MILGSADEWAGHFKRHDERLLERICEILPECIAAMPENAYEDDITINLVDRFHLDEVIRGIFHHWEYQFEPFGHDVNGVAFSKGKIDFVVCWDQDREKYLAYEAKRLNVKTKNGSTSSLAYAYVTQGLVRFVTEQYSEGLPVGCMLGYVLDGNTASVKPKIVQAVGTNSELVGLVVGPDDLPQIGSATRMTSDHQRPNGGGSITVRHALVPCC